MRRLLAGAALLALGACSRKPDCLFASDGCRVVFAYRASADGKTVDSAPKEAPADARLGSAGLVPGLEEGLRGAIPGERRTFAVPPEKAFGLHDPAGVQELPKALFASVGRLSKGMTVQGMSGGRPASGLVVAVGSATVRLDFNHPLAGKTLVYDVEVLKLEE